MIILNRAEEALVAALAISGGFDVMMNRLSKVPLCDVRQFYSELRGVMGENLELVDTPASSSQHCPFLYIPAFAQF